MSTCGCGCKGKGEVSVETIVRSLGTEISWADRIGGWRVRWNIRRMDYAVAPGLYRIGTPDADSPVLVTANYKLTRVAIVGLGHVVKHRNLIVPQLGATGVAAHEVKQATGFSVLYGPVRASDLPAYLAAGMRATPQMRRVRFGWRDRLVLTPTELVGAMKPLGLILATLLIFTLVRQQRLTAHFLADMVPFLAAALAGGVVVPLLLPWLPFRYFALKGAVAGLVVSAVSRLVLPGGIAETAGTSLIVVAATSYMAMMFTGSTTFTTLAGARLEVRRALPLIIASASVGAVLRVAAVFV